MKTKTPSQLIQVTALTLAIGVIPILSRAQDEPTEEAVAASPWTQADTKLANHYIRLLEKSPEYGNVLDLLWNLYEKKSQTELLLNYFESASKAENAPAAAVLIHAHLLRKSDNIEAARAAYDRVTDLEPENIPALLALAEIADLQKRSSKALSLYTRLIEKLPAESEEGLAIRLRKATLNQQLGQLDTAIRIWKELLSAYPDKPALRTEIVSLLLESGETETAISVLTELSESGDPRQQINALTELNRIYEFISNFQGAAVAGRKALELLHFKSRDYAVLFSRVVQLHEQFDRLTELENSLTEEVSEENPTEKSLHDLATFYDLTADLVKQEKTLQRLVESLPNNMDYRLELARTQLRNDRFDEAAAMLDGVIKESARPPLHLILLRAEIALNAEDHMAAETILGNHLDTVPSDAETLATIIDFARSNYLDGLVERLLKQSAESIEAVPPTELARFLKERGRPQQAVDVLNEYVTKVGEEKIERKNRLLQVTNILRDLDRTDEALSAIEEAIVLSPDELTLQEIRADVLIESGRIEDSVEQLSRVWDMLETLEEKSQIDQRLFSLLRGHFNKEPEPIEDPSLLSGGNIQTLAQYRKMAIVANKARRPGDEPPPEELIAFYENVKKAAETTKTLTNRYRAAWWAFKLQDNHECYAQLTTAKEEAGGPILDVELMLFSLAELNERTTLMVDHLTTLAEIDPANADDYLQRRAEMRFELGYEDEAIRELKKLAAKPEAPLTTLSTLAKVYAKQGSSGKQIEVWQQAYRQANSFEKRRIIKQLSTVLIENGRPEEALNAQLELLERESDIIQRRKLLDNQLNLARTHFLLDWMLERFQALTQQHPFDRFYPEALARVQQATGDTAGAFASLKKAYYMSEQNEGLLGELSAIADELGDLKSAIYYRRQLLSRGEGDQLENWQTLLTMLEKDLRLDEANLLRRRLENRFGRDPGFLSELAVHYKQDGLRADAQRVLARIVQLRDWDLQARFRLALIQSERGYHSEALANFLHVIENTPEVVYPGSFSRFARPLIRVARLDDDAKTDSGNELHSFVLVVEDFPYLGGSMQDEIAEALLANHREYQYLPAKPLWLRIRAIEEAAALSGLTGQADAWLARWGQSDRPDVEKLWAYRYLAGNDEAHARYGALLQSMPDSDAFINLFQGAFARLLAGNVDAIRAWINDPEARVGRHDRAACLSMAALVLLTDPVVDAGVSHDFLYRVISELPYLDKFGAYLFAELREMGFIDEAFEIGYLAAETMKDPDVSFLFSLSQIAGKAGQKRARIQALDQALDAMEPGDSIRSRDLFLSALTERLSLMDSDVPREKLINRLLREAEAADPASQSNKDEKKLLIQIAGHRYNDAIKTLGEVTSRQIDFIRPRDPDPDRVRYVQIQSWQRMDQLLRYYSARIPQDLRHGLPFADAISGDALALPVNDSAIAQFEQFEIGCKTLSLEWLSAPERAALALTIENQLVDPDSRFELGKSLETQGFHREAVQVYQAEIRRRGKNYAPMQGLFDASEAALDPEPALDVIHRLGTREYNPPPGITSSYIAEQHARFLAISRDIDRLVPLSRKPTGARGAPPITTQAHLPFQRALIAAYRQSGDEDALLRLLTHLRNFEEIENRHRLLGAKLLEGKGQPEEALKWLTEITLNGDDSELEREVMTQLARLYRSEQTADIDALVALAHHSLESQPHSAALALALATGEAGATEQALALLTTIRRNTSDRSNRFFTSLSLILTKHQQGIQLSRMPNEWEAIFHDFDYNDSSVNSAGLPESNASHLVNWINDLTGPSLELANLIAETPVPVEAAWLQQLIVAWNRDQLQATALELLADADRTGRDRILSTLPAFGESGIVAAREFISASAMPGTHYFADFPQQQVLFFHRIGDRARLLEVHSRFMQEAESDIFRQTGLNTEFATLLSRRKLPALFQQLGEKDLAGRLFRRYHEQLTSYRWNHHLFLEDFASYLIETEQFDEAENLLHKVFQKSLSVDLRLLMKLYADWGKLDSWEDRTAELHLTSGRRILLREWRTALAEGREMVEYTGSW